MNSRASSVPLVPVSVGEVYDKYSILMVKLSKIKNEEKLKHVKTEKEFLYKVLEEHYDPNESLMKDMEEVNTKLWEIEDKLRVKESKKEFDDEFIELARSVYYTNDERSVVKGKINKKFGSKIEEVKDYVKYK